MFDFTSKHPKVNHTFNFPLSVWKWSLVFDICMKATLSMLTQKFVLTMRTNNLL